MENNMKETTGRKRPGHEEQKLQIACVKWFELQYPWATGLLVHPMNEGMAGGRVRGAIGKAMGQRKGVSDLLLLLPSSESHYCYLAMELKTKTGRLSADQRVFLCRAGAAGARVAVIRSVEEFVKEVKRYMGGVNPTAKALVQGVSDDESMEWMSRNYIHDEGDADHQLSTNKRKAR